MTDVVRDKPPETLAVRPVAATSGKRLAPIVYEFVKERLLDGYYEAGERLSVERLKVELQVSKQPIMDAIRRLATEGLVEITPQVGCHVQMYEPSEVAAFFDVFAGTEGAVTGVAARWSTKHDIQTLERVNARIWQLDDVPGQVERSHGYRVLNRAFHEVIHDMARSRVIADISRRMWDLSDLLISTSGQPQPMAAAVHERHGDHQRIIEALSAGDAAEARSQMEAHILGTPGLLHVERD